MKRRAATEADGRSSLAALQETMAVVLTEPEPGGPAWLFDSIVPGGELDVRGALDVYRNGYVARLTEQLGETYPAVWRVLGDDAFFAVCESCIRRHGSVSYNLSDYGREFPAFVATSDFAAALPFLGELAAFELLVHDVFHEPGHEAVSASSLASLGELEGVRLRLGSTVRLLTFGHAVYDVYRHRDDEDVPDLDLERPQSVVLYKQEGVVRAREPETATFRLLEAFAAGLPVEEALAHVVEQDPSCDGAQIARAFEWIARCGLVAAIER